jgi:hypothetical protein
MSLPGAFAHCPGVTLSDAGVKENARGPADMVGNLVAEAAARCRAEPDIM